MFEKSRKLLKYAELFTVFEFTKNYSNFSSHHLFQDLPTTFFSEHFFKILFNVFKISVKFCVFYTHINLFKTFWGPKKTFNTCAKNTEHFTHFSKSSNYVFANIYLSPFDFFWNLKKVKLKSHTYTFYRSKFIKISVVKVGIHVFVVNIIGTIFCLFL
jgi:hypothetical protein